MTEQSDIQHKHEFSPDRLETRADLNELLSRRWSPRAFSEEPIEDWKVVTLFESARWAPSSANEQPWHFIAATKGDAAAYTALYESLSDGNRRWAFRAPLLVLGVARSFYARNGREYRHSWYDLGQSVAHLTVQASALGLAVHQMGGFDGEKVRQFFSVPDRYEPVVVFAVGYPERPEVLPDDLRSRERAPRSRKPLDTFVFTDGWGKPSRHVQSHNSLLDTLPSTN